MQIYAAPAGFVLDPESNKYYRFEIVADSVGGQTLWLTWFNCLSGQYEQLSYPVSVKARQGLRYPVPDCFTFSKNDGWYYNSTIGMYDNYSIPMHRIISFNAESGEFKMTFYPANPGAGAENYDNPANSKKPANKGVIAALLVVLLLGGAVLGHFMGWYALPFLSEKAKTVETEEMPDFTNAGNAAEEADPASTGTVNSDSVTEDTGQEADSETSRALTEDELTIEHFVTRNAHFMRNNIAAGFSIEDIVSDLKHSIESIHRIQERYTFLNFYGVVLGEFVITDDWIPSDDYVAEERPWYIGAYAANGEVWQGEPYIDETTGLMVTAYAILVISAEAEIIGVIAADVVVR